MIKIESRPDRRSLGQYVFLIDLDGHREDTVIRDALEGISRERPCSRYWAHTHGHRCVADSDLHYFEKAKGPASDAGPYWLTRPISIF